MDIDNSWDDVVNNGDEGLDSILTILDFPMESLEGDDCFIADWDASNSSHYFGPIPPDVLVDTGPPVLPPPIDTIHELKQSSPYLPDDACRSLIMLPNKSIEAQEPQGVFQIQSPISVLQTKSPVVKSCPSKRNRSKRASPSGPNPWLSISTAAGKARKNRERRKLLQLSVSDTKRCAHCQVTKTPQWREGPTGPKTLCNACGVRYRSGRLFPEYRPAASPIFVASLHSNSHRKVVEMRTKAIRQSGTKVEQLSMSPEMEFVPMSSHLFDDLM